MNAKTIKNTMKKTALALSLAASGFLASTAPAHAYYESDPWFHEWVGTTYVAFVEEVDNQFFAINTYLAEILDYMENGTDDSGTGIIGGINAQLAKIWEEARPFMENTSNQNAAFNRRTALDVAAGQTIMSRKSDPFNCSEIPMMTGARYATGGGGGHMAMRQSKGSSESKLAMLAGGTKPNDLSYANDAYSNHKTNGYCSPQDATFSDGTDRNRSGCSKGDINKMPDGDARVQSVFHPAHDFNTPSAVQKYGHSLTYNNGKTTPLDIGDQAKAADDAIATMVALFSPPALPKEVEQSPAGKILTTRIKVFNARVSPAIDFLTTQKAAHDASQSTLPKAVADVILSDFKVVYQRLFNATPPDTPSDADIVRYEVLRRYADPQGEWLKTLLASGDAAKVAQIQAQSQAVEMYLLYNMHERQVETNALLSALVAQSVNPITRAELEAAATKASK